VETGKVAALSLKTFAGKRTAIHLQARNVVKTNLIIEKNYSKIALK
jgi:hypothetical protein